MGMGSEIELVSVEVGTPFLRGHFALADAGALAGADGLSAGFLACEGGDEATGTAGTTGSAGTASASASTCRTRRDRSPLRTDNIVQLQKIAPKTISIVMGDIFRPTPDVVASKLWKDEFLPVATRATPGNIGSPMGAG
jgi:hypothetical protein